jgi:hypothetical protein
MSTNGACRMHWQGREVRFALVRLIDLNVDSKYQRDMSNRHVTRLIKNWNPLRFYPLVCSERPDGSLWVIEGQHRKEAAIFMLGRDALVPAMIWIHLSLKEEADGWLGNKDNRGTTMIQEHNASLTSETDQLALVIDSVLSARDLEASSGTLHSVKGVGTLRRVVETYGSKILEKVLDLMMDTYGMHQQTWSAPLIEGLAMTMVDYPEIDWKKVVVVLKQYGYVGGDTTVPSSGMVFAKNAVNNMNNIGERGSQAHKVEKFIIVRYNKSKRTKMLPLP